MNAYQRHIFGDGAAGSGSVTISVARDSFLWVVQWNLIPIITAFTTAAAAAVQLSTSADSQFNAHDVSGIISDCRFEYCGTTGALGSLQTAQNFVHQLRYPLRLPARTILYAHWTHSITSAAFHANLLFSDE